MIVQQQNAEPRLQEKHQINENMMETQAWLMFDEVLAYVASDFVSPR